MTYEMTPENLQRIAVGCVTEFLLKQASLSDSIAKQAQSLELNSEQTKRVIEASNTIAYLRQLEKVADRTFEFEVADYSKVMSKMAMPDFVEKVAKLESTEGSVAVGAVGTEDSNLSYTSSERQNQEKRAMLSKELFKAKGQLEKIAYDKIEMQLSLANAVSEFKKEESPTEKLAHVATEEDTGKMQALCGLEKKASENLVLVDSELSSARKVYELYKQATALVETEAKLLDFVKRANTVLFKQTANVEKLASVEGFFSAAAKPVAYSAGKAMQGVGMGINKIVGVPVKALGGSVSGNIGFGGAAKKRYGSVEKGVKAYDRMKFYNGEADAMKHFGGSKPSMLVHRVGLGRTATIGASGLAGLGMTHTNNVNDLNN